MKILIVEDEELVAELYARLLKDVADEVVIAYCIADIRKELQKSPPPDIVTLDLILKGPDGSHSNAFETLEEVKNIRLVNPDAVVVIVSGNTTEEVIKLAKELGVNHIVGDKTTVHTKENLIKAILQGFQHTENTSAQSTRRIYLIEILTKSIATTNQPNELTTRQLENDAGRCPPSSGKVS